MLWARALSGKPRAPIVGSVFAKSVAMSFGVGGTLCSTRSISRCQITRETRLTSCY